MIEFKNIYKSFKDKHVLEDVSFSIDKGEFRFVSSDPMWLVVKLPL